MKIINALYALYALLLFIILFALLFPFFLIPIIFKSLYKWVGILNRIWARIFFTLLFFKYQNEYRFAVDKSKQYIFCPNHFSYLDIPAMGLNEFNSVFVGKNDMEKVPLFGFMYRKLHITVNRNSLKSRYATLLRSIQALGQGKSLIIFPEGGMITQEAPTMAKFKDGAFRAAIEKQIPIVPVTIPFNWIILPDGVWLPKRHLLKVIYHEPIDTKGMTIDQLEKLKSRTFNVINEELKLQLNGNK